MSRTVQIQEKERSHIKRNGKHENEEKEREKAAKTLGSGRISRQDCARASRRPIILISNWYRTIDKLYSD